MNKLRLFLNSLLKKIGLTKDRIYYIGSKTALPAPLKQDEEKQLVKRLPDGDEVARATLIEHNLRLVVYIARKFENTGIHVEDLISIGSIGLIKAVNTFDPDKKIKLATYASRCIENEILMYLRTLKKQSKDVSIHSPIGQDQEGNEISLFDVIEANNEDIIEYLQLNMQLLKLKKHFSILDNREKTVLVYRYGLNNNAELTQKEIASMLGISRSYVSRIEKRALLKVFRAYYNEENTRK